MKPRAGSSARRPRALIGLSGLVVVLAIAAAAPGLTRFFLASEAPDLVATVRWIALAVLLNVAGTYALAVLNGYRSYPYLALAQVAGPAALVLLLAGAGWWHCRRTRSSWPRLLCCALA
jgi:O-antigen/teichoic acid export membrane protein